METTTLSADQIIARHSVQDEAKVERIAADMQANGWQGRPVLVVRHGDAYKGLTGVHRLAAVFARFDEADALAIVEAEIAANNAE